MQSDKLHGLFPVAQADAMKPILHDAPSSGILQTSIIARDRVGLLFAPGLCDDFCQSLLTSLFENPKPHVSPARQVRIEAFFVSLKKRGIDDIEGML
jgi:hypothetical protein